MTLKMFYSTIEQSVNGNLFLSLQGFLGYIGVVYLNLSEGLRNYLQKIWLT